MTPLVAPPPRTPPTTTTTFCPQYGLLSPFDVPQEIVFGEPMEVGEAVADPPKEVVAELHAKYIASLTKLFDDNKAKFGVGDRKLVVA